MNAKKYIRKEVYKLTNQMKINCKGIGKIQKIVYAVWNLYK